MSLHAPVSAGPVAVTVRGLQHWFGEAEARKQALFDIDLDIHAGELTVVMGASGSGNTTLLTLVGCLRGVQQGSAQLFGQELLGADEATLVRMRRQLGFIFQAHNLHDSLTALQNVRLGLALHGGRADREWEPASTHLLGLLGLGERLNSTCPQGCLAGRSSAWPSRRRWWATRRWCLLMNRPRRSTANRRCRWCTC